MSKCCLTSVTSLSRVHPVLDEGRPLLELVAEDPDAEALPAHLRERVDAGVLKVTSVVPLRAKTWAMLTRSLPVSRCARRLGSQSIPNSACLPSDDLLGADVGPAGLDGHVEAGAPVVTLRLARRSSRRTGPARPTCSAA